MSESGISFKGSKIKLCLLFNSFFTLRSSSLLHFRFCLALLTRDLKIFPCRSIFLKEYIQTVLINGKFYLGRPEIIVLCFGHPFFWPENYSLLVILNLFLTWATWQSCYRHGAGRNSAKNYTGKNICSHCL